MERAIEEEEEIRAREDLPSYRQYELLEQLYREGGWVEICNEDQQEADIKLKNEIQPV